MGDRRKLKAWFSTPPVLSFLLSILLFVVTPPCPSFCLFSLQASLLPCDSPSFTPSLCCRLSSLVFSENRCQMRKLLDVQLLRRFWLGIAQAGRFHKCCVTRGVLSRVFELALECSRIQCLHSSFSHDIKDDQIRLAWAASATCSRHQDGAGHLLSLPSTA